MATWVKGGSEEESKEAKRLEDISSFILLKLQLKNKDQTLEQKLDKRNSIWSSNNTMDTIIKD